jgi:hypothetical protein
MSRIAVAWHAEPGWFVASNAESYSFRRGLTRFIAVAGAGLGARGGSRSDERSDKIIAILNPWGYSSFQQRHQQQGAATMEHIPAILALGLFTAVIAYILWSN